MIFGAELVARFVNFGAELAGAVCDFWCRIGGRCL